MSAEMRVVKRRHLRADASLSQTISELSAIGGPTRSLWVWLVWPYTLSVLLMFAAIVAGATAFGQCIPGLLHGDGSDPDPLWRSDLYGRTASRKESADALVWGCGDGSISAFSCFG